MNSSIKRYEEYLNFKKKYSKYWGDKGDWEKGEIEFINDINLFPECEKGSANLMMKAGVSEKDARKRARVGIFDENKWGISAHDPLRLPDGSYTTFNRWISWGGLNSGFAGVVIVPVLTDGRIVFLKNYRNATREWCLELPRGGKDVGDKLIRTVKNELSEEIGAEIIGKAKKIGEVFPDSGVLASRVGIFEVKVNLTKLPDHEATEAIRGIVFLKKSEIKKILKTQEYIDSDGKRYEFKDALTLSSLALLFNN